MTGKKRVIVYIDGFNFYYGLKKCGIPKDATELDLMHPRWKKYYWIDIVKLFESLLKDDEELLCVKYFTAIPLNKTKAENQDIFFRANRITNNTPSNKKFRSYLGKYRPRKMTCKAYCGMDYNDHEEKQTDVNICLSMVEDFIMDNCDKTILVSADSDMVPPIRTIQKFQTLQSIKPDHELMVYVPAGQKVGDKNQYKVELKYLSGFRTNFNQSIMPDTISNSEKSVTIPKKWKKHQSEPNPEDLKTALSRLQEKYNQN